MYPRRLTDIRNILSCLFLYTVLLSCSDVEDVSQQNSQHSAELLLSVGKTEHLTRQTGDVVQDDGQAFRGLKSLQVIPFATTNGGAVTSTDDPLLSTALGNYANRVSDLFYYYLSCNLMIGVNRVLVYAQAADVDGKTALAQNGKLETTLVNRMSPSDISFSLSQIRNTFDIHSDAQALAKYMTAIAKTDGWSTTSDSQLKALYLQFIHADAQTTGLMAGSAAHVKAYVKALSDILANNNDELSVAIKKKIGDINKIDCLNNGYPSASTSLGLPDGAAALRWTGEAFSVRTATTTLDNINGINRYTYPAELWYYANSSISTSADEIDKSSYAGKTWNEILFTLYTDGKSVMPRTRSVAVEQPVQYGVGRLQMTLTDIAATLKDAQGQTFLGSNSDLELTGVIIGGQHTVGFDFKPKEPQSDVDARFIYDSEVGTAGTDGKWTVNTLVLQSYDGEKVPVVLEFKNNSEYQFTGKDGIIYPGTKFYLIGQLDPADKGAENYAGRVFTQDYTTKVGMKVTSLANAYSCMPDLLAPRLEIGVEVLTSWIQSTTTNVML